MVIVHNNYGGKNIYMQRLWQKLLDWGTWLDKGDTNHCKAFCQRRANCRVARNKNFPGYSWVRPCWLKN